jgi:hypothetical protein
MADSYSRKPDADDPGFCYGQSPYDQPITVNNYGDDPLLRELIRVHHVPRYDLANLMDKETGRLIANARGRVEPL